MNPNKPEDRTESWLRKMSEKLSRRSTPVDIKAEAEEADEPEDEQETEAQSDAGSVVLRSRKKKRSKNPGPTWTGCLIVLFRWGMLGLAMYGLWRLAS